MKLTILTIAITLFSAPLSAGFVAFPDDKEEILEWCEPNDQLKSEYSTPSDEEPDWERLEEEEDQDGAQFIACILSLQAFIKGVEAASKRSYENPPKLCNEADISIGDFLLKDAEELFGFEEIAWEYLYGRCNK